MEKPCETRKKGTDPEELKELIQEYIDEEASDEHLDIAKASAKELKQIQVVLKE